MGRDEAMRAAAANGPAVNKWLMEGGPQPHDFATAGADAELARVVEWLRDRAARTKVRRVRWILLWLAREIELRAHWPKESDDGQ